MILDKIKNPYITQAILEYYNVNHIEAIRVANKQKYFYLCIKNGPFTTYEFFTWIYAKYTRQLSLTEMYRLQIYKYEDIFSEKQYKSFINFMLTYR